MLINISLAYDNQCVPFEYDFIGIEWLNRYLLWSFRKVCEKQARRTENKKQIKSGDRFWRISLVNEILK